MATMVTIYYVLQLFLEDNVKDTVISVRLNLSFVWRRGLSKLYEVSVLNYCRNSKNMKSGIIVAIGVNKGRIERNSILIKSLEHMEQKIY